MEQLAFNFEQLEEAIVSPLAGCELEPAAGYIASLLLEASAAQPMTSDYLIRAVREQTGENLNLRRFHNIIRSLRKNNRFPILSRRTKPAGYWWCKSLDEMNAFITDFRSQAMDELHTLSRIVNKNYPALAGQMRFEDLAIEE
jgi:hypothetical protein